MRDITFYMDQAKSRSGIKSDRKLAEFIGMSPQSGSFWRLKKVTPTDETMIKLANLAGADEEEALIDLNIWRSPPAAQKAYANILHKLAQITAAIVVIAASTLSFAPSSAHAEVSSDKTDSIYYGK